MKGSHNTLTYGNPVRWWGWLCSAVWRCQRKGIAEQVAAGCRVFDIRFARLRRTDGDDVENMWVSAHGIVDLRVNPVAAIEEIAQRYPSAYIRVTLEKERGEDDRDEFRRTCRWLEERFSDVVFFNGRLKPGWEKLYTFKREEWVEESLVQHCGSMSNQWWGKVFPWLWAKLHPLDDAEHCLILIMDFV
ncbi:MAG: hypothetical protein NC421_07610 [Lachnospiraceae bacterium]|nr:hypothetical protein [Lachnospiraceae bacterium]